MTHEEMIEASHRNEGQIYLESRLEDEVPLPLTRIGFESLLVRACVEYELPVDDISRQFAIEYIHHLEKDVKSIKIEDISQVLYRRSANHVTWVFAKEINERNKQKQGPTLVPDPDIEH